VDLEPPSGLFLAVRVPYSQSQSQRNGDLPDRSVATGNSAGLGAISNTVVSSSVLSPNGLGDSIEMNSK
jgi:hypothetical protein